MKRTVPRRSDVVLERLTRLHPKLIDLSLGRTETLLARLGNPEKRLPPVVHVAGTNGKGSVIAFLRAMAEAAGLAAHVYTSPHLVRFHERIVVAGREIDEDALLAVLDECEAANEGEPITFFEITTAAALLAFSRTPADVALLETGLGGRFDSTNVIDRPALTAITPVSIDHTQFLGETIGEIAFEKAGILKPGVAAVIGRQPAAALDVIEARAGAIGAPLLVQDRDWTVARDGDSVLYADADGEIGTPLPNLLGPHQIDNAGMAIALARRLRAPAVGAAAIASGVAAARWPARLQRLGPGPVADRIPLPRRVLLDGGHNPGAGLALAAAMADEGPASVTYVCAMLANKDAAGFLAPLAPSAHSLIAIDLPSDSPGIPREELAAAARAAGIDAITADGLDAAMGIAAARGAGAVVICGSLYLAGAVLAANEAVAQPE